MIAVGATLVAFVFERGRGQAGGRIDNVTTTIFHRPTENLEVRVYRTLVYRATEVDGESPLGGKRRSTFVYLDSNLSREKQKITFFLLFVPV